MQKCLWALREQHCQKGIIGQRALIDLQLAKGLLIGTCMQPLSAPLPPPPLLQTPLPSSPTRICDWPPVWTTANNAWHVNLFALSRCIKQCFLARLPKTWMGSRTQHFQ